MEHSTPASTPTAWPPFTTQKQHRCMGRPDARSPSDRFPLSLGPTIVDELQQRNLATLNCQTVMATYNVGILCVQQFICVLLSLYWLYASVPAKTRTEASCFSVHLTFKWGRPGLLPVWNSSKQHSDCRSSFYIGAYSVSFHKVAENIDSPLPIRPSENNQAIATAALVLLL